MRRIPGYSPMRLALVLTMGFFVVVVVVAAIVTRSGGNDAQTASTTPASAQRVKVVIAGTNDALKNRPTEGSRASAPSGQPVPSPTAGQSRLTGRYRTRN